MISKKVLDELVQTAREARNNAYAPYSHYPVGAAVLTASGRVYAGCNVEIAINGLSVCAERVAVTTAVAAGEREIIAVAVVTPTEAAPCGACRQVLAEFLPAAGHGDQDMLVIIAGEQGYQTMHLSDLLPRPFLPNELKE